MNQRATWSLFWFAGWFLLILIFVPNPARSEELHRKSYREFVVIHDYDNRGHLVAKGTRLLPKDDELLARLKRINKIQCTFGEQNVSEVMNIIRETDLSLVVHRALILLPRFPDVHFDTISELHTLAYSNSPEIKAALPFVLAWFRYPESITTLIILANDQDRLVSCNARMALNYFGVEVLSALPFINMKYDRFDRFFLAKVIQHIHFLVFVAAGQQILFPAKYIFNPRGSPQCGIYGNDIDRLSSLKEIANPDLVFPPEGESEEVPSNSR
ncbi:MAG: HEAT repeat domain-containing protein [Candidatus Ozemobacteraceae bacterium]